MKLFIKRLTKTEYLEKSLEKALRKSSRGKMPKATRISLAKRTIRRIDLNNPYQTHKSIEGYADILTQNYLAKVRGQRKNTKFLGEND